MKIYLYHGHDDAAQPFYRNECKPIADFCFFSSRRKILEHFYIQNNCCYEPYDFKSLEDNEWACKHIWNLDNGMEVDGFIPVEKLSLDILEEFYKRAKGDSIIEIELDKYE